MRTSPMQEKNVCLSSGRHRTISFRNCSDFTARSAPPAGQQAKGLFAVHAGRGDSILPCGRRKPRSITGRMPTQAHRKRTAKQKKSAVFKKNFAPALACLPIFFTAIPLVASMRPLSARPSYTAPCIHHETRSRPGYSRPKNHTRRKRPLTCPPRRCSCF